MTAEKIAKVRQAIVSARAVLLTAMHDNPESLVLESRAKVIKARIDSLNDAIGILDTAESGVPT